MHRPDERQLREQQGKFTFFWKGHDQQQLRTHRVGFAIQNDLLPKLAEVPVGINERLMTLRIQLIENRHTTIINAYASTVAADDEEKEGFYTP